MVKIISSLFFLISLAVTHYLIIDNSEKIASRYTIPYQEMSDEEASRQLILETRADSSWVFGEYEPSKEVIALHKFGNYRQFASKHIEPIQEQIESAANIFFFIAYMILATFVARVFYRWMQVDGGRLMLGGSKKVGNVSIDLLSKLGLNKLLLNHQLKLAEKEFIQVKNLFDNGLIAEEEFLEKKAVIKNKIRNGDLLRK